MGQAKVEEIRNHVRSYYEDLYDDAAPHRLSSLPITTGMALASLLGYPQDILKILPESYWEKFFPCGNPISHIRPKAGDRVLNLGCGAALDSFCLHCLYGNTIEITSLDVVFPILQRNLATFRGVDQILSSLEDKHHWVCGDAENLPFRSGIFDWVILNGVFNLFKDKLSLLHGIKEILKPQGSLVGVDLCCSAPLPPYFDKEMDAWAWCMSGACTEVELHSLLDASGFLAGRLLQEEEAGSFYRIAFICRKAAAK